MSDYTAASHWTKLAYKFLLLAFVLDLFAMSGGLTANQREVQALLILAFLTLLAAEILLFLLIYYPAFRDNFPAKICICVCSFITGFFIILGLGLSARCRGTFGCPASVPYPTTLVIMAAIFSILGGVFMVLETVGPRSNKTGSHEQKSTSPES